MRRRLVQHRDRARLSEGHTVDGLDLDDASVELARANVEGTGVEDRVSFQHRDAGDPQLAGSYQLVTVFEALHDMSRPVDVLRALRGLVAEDGAVLVMDERVADSFTAPATRSSGSCTRTASSAAFRSGCRRPPRSGRAPSCVPKPCAATPPKHRFADVEVLPIEHDFFRVYRFRG